MKHIRTFNESQKDDDGLNEIHDIFVEFIDGFNTKEITDTDRFSNGNIFEAEFDEIDRLFYIIEQSALRSMSGHDVVYKDSFYVLMKYIKEVVIGGPPYGETGMDKKVKSSIQPIIERLKRSGFICDVKYENYDNDELNDEEATWVEDLQMWCNVVMVRISIK